MKRHPTFAYLFFAFLFSWMVAVPLALQRSGVLSTRLPYSLHYLMAFGPMLGALIVVSGTQGRAAWICIRRRRGDRHRLEIGSPTDWRDPGGSGVTEKRAEEAE